jgi:hypothetical protein
MELRHLPRCLTRLQLSGTLGGRECDDQATQGGLCPHIRDLKPGQLGSNCPARSILVSWV